MVRLPVPQMTGPLCGPPQWPTWWSQNFGGPHKVVPHHRSCDLHWGFEVVDACPGFIITTAICDHTKEILVKSYWSHRRWCEEHREIRTALTGSCQRGQFVQWIFCAFLISLYFVPSDLSNLRIPQVTLINWCRADKSNTEAIHLLWQLWVLMGLHETWSKVQPH